MHPFLLRIPLPWGGVLRLPTYGFCIMVGFLLALYLLRRRGKRFGLHPQHLLDLSVCSLFGGVIGARLFYVVEYWGEYFRGNPLQIFRIDQGGLVFYGGLIGGGATMLVMIVLKRLPMLRTLDVVASVVPLAHAFGRIGCFMTGCCFGRVCHLPWAVRFPKIEEKMVPMGSPAFAWQWEHHMVTLDDDWSLPVHPTQLYAVIYNLIIFAGLTLLLRRRPRTGLVLGVYLIAYSVCRSVNEYFRADTPPMGGLSIAQWISIVGIAVGAAVLIVRLRGKAEPAEEAAPALDGPAPAEDRPVPASEPRKGRRRRRR